MKKLLLLALAGAGLSLSASAQQRPQYSQYMMNNYLLNPAVTGVEDFLDFKAGMRRQWVGLEGAPITYYASAHAAIGKTGTIHTPFSLSQPKGGKRAPSRERAQSSRFNKVTPHHGVGAMVELDKLGPLSTKGVHVSYAYHQPLAQNIRVSLGLSAGWRQFSLDADEFHTLNPNDPAVLTGQVNNSNFDLGAGLWLYSPVFYLGASSSQLLGNQLDFSGTGSGEGKLQPHFFGTAGVRLNVSNDFAFVPSVLVKVADPAPASFDINLKGVYAETVWAGLSWREDDAVSVMIGGNVTPRISAGYSYDFTTSTLNKVSSGSHEVVLGLRMGNPLGESKWLPWW